MAIELHVVEEEQDLTSYLSLFLPEYAECENCEALVGRDAKSRFRSLVICIDDDDSWLVCLDCAASVVYPGE